MLYRIRDAAFRLGCSVTALEWAVRKGNVRSVRITKDCIRISEEELERLIFEQIEIETNLNVEAVTEILAVTERIVCGLCREGRLSAKKLKRRWVINAPDLQRFIKDNVE